MLLEAPGVSSLSPTALRVLIALLSHANFSRLDGLVWPTVASLSTLVGRGGRQVTRALRELEGSGLVESLGRTRSGGRLRRVIIPELFAADPPDTVWQAPPSPDDSLPQPSGVTQTETETEPFGTQTQNSTSAAPSSPAGEDPVPLAALLGKHRARAESVGVTPPAKTNRSRPYDALPESAFSSRAAMATALREAGAHGLLDSEANSEAQLFAWTTLAHFAHRRAHTPSKAGGYLRRVLELHDGSLERAAASVPAEFEDEARRWIHRHR